MEGIKCQGGNVIKIKILKKGDSFQDTAEWFALERKKMITLLLRS